MLRVFRFRARLAAGLIRILLPTLGVLSRVALVPLAFSAWFAGLGLIPRGRFSVRVFVFANPERIGGIQ